MSTMDGTPTNLHTVGARAAVVQDLKLLKAPEEGGNKKEYGDFLKKIQNHVLISWEMGRDVAFVLKYTKDPTFEEPEDLSEEDEKKKWKVRIWNQKVDHYGTRISMLKENKSSLYLYDTLYQINDKAYQVTQLNFIYLLLN